MTTPTVDTLRASGATIHYEVRGSGPILLLIAGGTGGAASFADVVEDLATDHTVVTYDPRGIGRSPLDHADAEQHVAEHAEDAFRLLELLAPGEEARVFGSSSGAIAALHLATAHPERIARVVAHEPPVVEVLPDAADHRALVARVRETFRTEGLQPAMAVFAAGVSGDRADEQRPQPELPPRAAERVARSMADLPYFLGQIVPRFMSYVPDLPRLERLSERLVVAAGEDSHGELPYRAASVLAERTGAPLQLFPGGHIGLTTHPEEFGARLRGVLTTPAR